MRKRYSLKRVMSIKKYRYREHSMIRKRPAEIRNELGERLKEFRNGKCLSQKAFASLLSTSSGYISEIEQGKKMPGGEFLISLKREFGVDLDLEWFLMGESGTQTAREAAHAELRKNLSKRLHTGGIDRWYAPGDEPEASRTTRGQFLGYLNGTCDLTDEQLRVLCMRAGGKFKEDEFWNALKGEAHAEKNYNPKPAPSKIHEELLEAVIEEVEEALLSLGKQATPKQTTQLILALYDLSSKKEDRTVDKPTALRLVKLMAA